MSCTGCMYTIGKTATCDRSYACNTTGERPEKVAEKKVERKSRRNRQNTADTEVTT